MGIAGILKSNVFILMRSHMVIRAPSPFDTIGLSILFFAAIIMALSFEIFHEEYND